MIWTAVQSCKLSTRLMLHCCCYFFIIYIIIIIITIIISINFKEQYLMLCLKVLISIYHHKLLSRWSWFPKVQTYKSSPHKYIWGEMRHINMPFKITSLSLLYILFMIYCASLAKSLERIYICLLVLFGLVTKHSFSNSLVSYLANNSLITNNSLATCTQPKKDKVCQANSWLKYRISCFQCLQKVHKTGLITHTFLCCLLKYTWYQILRTSTTTSYL